MRVVKQGCLPEEKPFRLECSYCSTVVEVTEKDLKVDTITGTKMVNCPLCHKAICDTQATRMLTGGQAEPVRPSITAAPYSLQKERDGRI